MSNIWLWSLSLVGSFLLKQSDVGFYAALGILIGIAIIPLGFWTVRNDMRVGGLYGFGTSIVIIGIELLLGVTMIYGLIEGLSYGTMWSSGIGNPAGIAPNMGGLLASIFTIGLIMSIAGGLLIGFGKHGKTKLKSLKKEREHERDEY